MSESVNCYDVPKYWDLAFNEDTELEADFVEAAARKYCDFQVKSLLEPGCGGGRLTTELARRGYHVTGWDLSQQSVDFANARLKDESLAGKIAVEDMRHGCVPQGVDLAYCFVNTFRHLLTEDDAVQHLMTVAGSLRPGGLYIIGMHLFPPDADEEDSEDWSVTEGNVTVNMLLDVASCDRAARREVLRFSMSVTGSDHPSPKQYQSDYQMRLYEAADFKSLIDNVPEFQLLPEVYDFWYDIEEPLTLSNELGDTVFILQRRDVPADDGVGGREDVER